MQLLRLLAVAVACVVGVVGYVQEGRRLEEIRRLPGPRARDYYEKVRVRSDRMMWAIALVLAVGALVAVVRLVSRGSWESPALVPSRAALVTPGVAR